MKASEKILTVFRSRLEKAHETEYAVLAPKIYEVAKKMPGFLSAKTFTATDGERVTIVEFDSMENHRAWSDHPTHRTAKDLGIAKFYINYDISVCRVVHERHFAREMVQTSKNNPK